MLVPSPDLTATAYPTFILPTVSSFNLSIHHHEPIQISLRRILKKNPPGSKQSSINVAIADLVAAKRLIKSSHSYNNVIASLQWVGVDRTYDALMKRVARASVENSTAEIRIPNPSIKSVGCPLYHLTNKPMIHSPLRKRPKPHHMRINHLKLLNSNLVLEVGPK